MSRSLASARMRSSSSTTRSSVMLRRRFSQRSIRPCRCVISSSTPHERWRAGIGSSDRPAPSATTLFGSAGQPIAKMCAYLAIARRYCTAEMSAFGPRPSKRFARLIASLGRLIIASTAGGASRAGSFEPNHFLKAAGPSSAFFSSTALRSALLISRLPLSNISSAARVTSSFSGVVRLGPRRRPASASRISEPSAPRSLPERG